MSTAPLGYLNSSKLSTGPWIAAPLDTLSAAYLLEHVSKDHELVITSISDQSAWFWLCQLENKVLIAAKESNSPIRTSVNFVHKRPNSSYFKLTLEWNAS